MSATVTISALAPAVEVPNAETCSIDSDGRLHLSPLYRDDVAVFQHWEYVVIRPERDSRGRFIRRGA